MSQANKPQFASREHLTGQRIVAVCAAAVVLLLALTFFAISQASRPGVQGAPAPQLPPGKATLLARGEATLAAARTANPHPAKPPFTLPPAVPTATFTAGIFYYDGQDKFQSFQVQYLYRGEVNGTWEFVYTGSDTTQSGTGIGAVRVETFSNATGYALVGVFDAPDHSTYTGIIGITGNVLRITSDKTASFGFDLATNTYTK